MVFSVLVHLSTIGEPGALMAAPGAADDGVRPAHRWRRPPGAVDDGATQRADDGVHLAQSGGGGGDRNPSTKGSYVSTGWCECPGWNSAPTPAGPGRPQRDSRATWSSSEQGRWGGDEIWRYMESADRREATTIAAFQPRKHTMWPLLHWEDYLQGFGTPAVKPTSRLVPAGTYRLRPGSGLTTRAASGTTITPVSSESTNLGTLTWSLRIARASVWNY